KKLLAIKDPYLCGVLARSLISQNKKVPKKIWKKIATSPEDQFYTIQIFEEDSLRNNLPKHWLKKDLIAKLKFYTYLSEDYASAKMEDIELLKIFPFEYKGEVSNIYAYKFTYEDSEDHHVGISALPAAKEAIDLSPYSFFNYSYEPVESGKEDETIDSFLEWYKTDNEKWEKEKLESEE
ncbi:MAG: hypothetical protein AAF573_20965, partial [Bacteroidota bacterium]